MGMKVFLFTTSLESVAMMPCNPSVGGPGKGHLVKEIDALGGEMARCTDAAAIQIRRLNTGKGPAVQALRAQVDRRRYHLVMRQTLEKQERLYLQEAIVTDVITDDRGVTGVLTKLGRRFRAPAVVLCPGPYLAGRVHVGLVNYVSGPRGHRAADELAACLSALGLRMLRFKTGTPPRVHRRSLDLSVMTPVPGEPLGYGFAEREQPLTLEQEPCWLTYTNAETHRIIRENLHRSAMYSGNITGTGPRYCPSIEAKLVMFPDRERHQVFVEPEGRDTQEMYLAGVSTSLPEEIQHAFVRTIPGLERAEFTRCGYAIEYDCLDSCQLTSALAVKGIPGLFTAGQINGTTGYEEAAAQGLLAGINAVCWLRREEPVVLGRAQAYIGVLVDDLVTKGTGEPYRILTSRAEYRLLLRENTADRRLTPLGYELGLIDRRRYERFQERLRAVEKELARLESVLVQPNAESEAFLTALGSAPLTTAVPLADILRRPEVRYEATRALDPARPDISPRVAEIVETSLHYAGYERREQARVEAQQRMESRRIPAELNYAAIPGLSREAREKLQQILPRSVGQAARIPGVTPADIAVLLVHLEHLRRMRC
jgi:tRNA uridine 5-carboxymethylaminomethyl modification enzyme